MADLDRLLRSDISRAAEDAAKAPDVALIESRGVRRHRTRTAIAVAAAFTALVAALGGLHLVRCAAAPSRRAIDGHRHSAPAAIRHYRALSRHLPAGTP